MRPGAGRGGGCSRGQLVLAGAVLGGGVAVMAFGGRPFPDCDAAGVTARLSGLYDDRRLLHAVAVVAPH